MRSKVILAAALLAMSAAIPSWAVPFGVFGGLTQNRDSATGVVGLHGWALDASGVARVDVFVDGVSVGRAHYGTSRPGVAVLHPGFPDSHAAGFGFLLDSTRFDNGLHQLSVVVTANDGSKRTLGPRVVEFVNTTHLLVPFGRLTFPQQFAELRGACNLQDPLRRYSVVEGWALDAGVEELDRGVAWVELLIDGAIFANSRRDCYFAHETGGLSNCYGLPSLDVERHFPTLPNGSRARFRCVLDVGALINFGYPPGHRVLTIRAGDIAGQVVLIDEVAVSFMCDEFLPNEPSVGRIDVPPRGPIYSGTVDVHGWAIDWEGVSRVDIYANGQLMGTAMYGFPRPGVAALYPGYPNSQGAGFLFFLDSRVLADGRNDIQAVVVDVFGVETLIGERTITVHNP
jgi:hypothetical protein